VGLFVLLIRARTHIGVGWGESTKRKEVRTPSPREIKAEGRNAFLLFSLREAASGRAPTGMSGIFSPSLSLSLSLSVSLLLIFSRFRAVRTNIDRRCVERTPDYAGPSTPYAGPLTPARWKGPPEDRETSRRVAPRLRSRRLLG
jgi:hypothetical protein